MMKEILKAAIARFAPERPRGFMVHFEESDGRFLTGRWFPDARKGEPLIRTERQAWSIARKFAKATAGRCVNIYVTDDKAAPVPNYRERMIVNR